MDISILELLLYTVFSAGIILLCFMLLAYHGGNHSGKK